LSEECCLELIAKAVATALAGAQVATNGVGGGGGGSVIKEKVFSDVSRFEKGECFWKDWSYDYKIARGTQSPEMLRRYPSPK
jgi:hypothetical protein